MNSTGEDDGPEATGADGTSAEAAAAAEFVAPRRRRSTYTPPPQFADEMPASESGPSTSAQPESEPSGRPAPSPQPEPLAEPAPEPAGGSPRRAGHRASTDLPAEPSRDGERPYVPWVPDLTDRSSAWDRLFTDPPAAEAAASFSYAVDSSREDHGMHRAPVAESPEQVAPETGVPAPSAPPSPAAAAPSPAADAAPYLSPDGEAEVLASLAVPAGQPWIPERRSLPDATLLSIVGAVEKQPGGVLSAIDTLENQMRMREEELQQYRDWEDQMLAVGTPEALAVIEKVRPEFSSIVVPEGLTTSQITIFAETFEPPATSPGGPSAPPAEVPLPPAAPIEPSAPDEPAAPEVPSAPEEPVAPEQPVAPVQPVAPEEPVAPEVPLPPEAPLPAEAPLQPSSAAPTSAAPTPVTDEEIVVHLSPLVPVALVEPQPAQSRPGLPEDWFRADPSSFPTPAEPVDLTPVPFTPAPFRSVPSNAQTPDVEAPGTGSIGTGSFTPPPFGAGPTPTAPPGPAVPPAAPQQDGDNEPDFDSLLTGQSAAQASTPAVIAAPVAPAGPTPTRTRAPIRPRSEERAEREPLFSIEVSGAEPTPLDRRVGQASRLFWLWFAANSSVLSVAFGAMVFSLGMSLRQSIVATLAGIALSFIPLSLGTLAGKWSGQPTVIVSRATFGLAGNIVPAVLAVVTRVFWGAVLLWLFGGSVAAVAGGVGDPIDAALVTAFTVVGALVATAVAFFGYSLLARFQLVVSVLSGALIVAFIALTAGKVDIETALTVDDGPWTLVVTGAVLVFSFVGLVWATSTSDLARYQRGTASGASTMLWASFGTTVPTFLLIAWGSLLAASDPVLASGFAADPVAALAGILPGWFAVPLIAATALSLLSGVIVVVYSGAFALQGVGLRIERYWATFVVGGAVAVIAILLGVLALDLTDVFRDLATTIAVPVAAWVGIFGAETMIRNRPYHAISLLRPGGIYPRVNVVNLAALLVITVIGFGLTTATVAGLDWQGYLLALAGVAGDSDLAASDLGVVVALLLGILTPFVFGVRTIRNQESAPEPVQAARRHLG